MSLWKKYDIFVPVKLSPKMLLLNKSIEQFSSVGKQFSVESESELIQIINNLNFKNMITIIRKKRVMEPETIQKTGANLKSRTGSGNVKLLTLLAFIVLFGVNAPAQGIIPPGSNAQVNNLRRADRMNNKQRERLLKFDKKSKMNNERIDSLLKSNQQREIQRGAVKFPDKNPFEFHGKKPFENGRCNFPVLRAAQETVQVLDSIVSKSSDGEYIWKEEYKYDSNGRQTLYAYYDWDSDVNAWVGNSKYEYQYDNNNNQISEVDYYWNSNANAWVESYKSECQYDNNNNQILEVDYSWDSNAKVWIESYKYEYQYDNNNNQILEVDYSWDSNAKVWIESYKYECQYDNNQILEVDYYWDSDANAWVEMSKYEYQCDNNNNLILEVDSYWDSDANEWVERSKYEYQYDNNNNLTLYAYYDWNSDANEWVEWSKYEFQYDNNNNPILWVGYFWDSIANAWVEVYKNEYQYDNNNNQILEVGYYWDSDANALVENSKHESQYDDNNDIISATNYDWNGDVCTITNYQYYYSPLTINSISSVYTGGNTAVFPNPATDYIVVKGDATSIITVSNLSGGVIYKGETLAGERKTIDVSSWASGVYIITVETGNNKTTSKIVKK